jgi:hypothetical protein
MRNAAMEIRSVLDERILFNREPSFSLGTAAGCFGLPASVLLAAFSEMTPYCGHSMGKRKNHQ